jgi:hypothetical protein
VALIWRGVSPWKQKKSFSSMRDDKSDLRLEERKKNFVGYVYVGIQCSVWLVDMVVEVLSLGKEDFVKSYCEDEKVLMVHGGGNKAGHYLEVAIYAKGGRKGIIWLP